MTLVGARKDVGKLDVPPTPHSQCYHCPRSTGGVLEGCRRISRPANLWVLGMPWLKVTFTGTFPLVWCLLGAKGWEPAMSFAWQLLRNDPWKGLQMMTPFPPLRVYEGTAGNGWGGEFRGEASLEGAEGALSIFDTGLLLRWGWGYSPF